MMPDCSNESTGTPMISQSIELASGPTTSIDGMINHPVSRGGVCGKKTICVVTMTRDVDLARARFGLTYCTKDTILRKFRKTVISEMEDLESTTGKSIKMPFGVVCVTDNLRHTSHTDVADKGSGLEHPDEFDKKDAEQFEKTKNRVVSTLKKTIMARSVFVELDEEKAIEFLKEKMKTESNEDFTVEETIQAAISAFQHLLKRELKANEIEVSYIDPDYKVWGRGILRTSNINFKELNIGSIEDYLAIINSNGTRNTALGKEDSVERGLGKQNGCKKAKMSVNVDNEKSKALRLADHPTEDAQN